MSAPPPSSLLRPIRILRVIPRYAPAWRYGGSVRFSHDLDHALTGRGFSVTIYTSDQVDEHRRHIRSHEMLQSLEVRRFPNPWNALASRAAWLGLYPIGLKRALRERVGDFDLLHVTEARGPHARWAFAAARSAGVPVAWSPLGSLADGTGLRGPYRRLYDTLHATRRLVAEAAVLIAQSPHEAEVFERLGARPSQIRIIPLGIDAAWFRELPPRGAFRQSLGVAPEQTLLLFVGRLHPSKGLDVLLRAAAIVRRTQPNLRIVLIGWDHGALRTVRRMTRLLRLDDAVIVRPPVFDLARVQAYVDADAFVVAATSYEETSLAALEALAAGTPCVLTHQCEVPGLEAMGGGAVTECTPQALAAGLHRVLSCGRFRAADARRAVLDSWTLQHRAEAYASTFRDITGRSAADAHAGGGLRRARTRG